MPTAAVCTTLPHSPDQMPTQMEVGTVMLPCGLAELTSASTNQGDEGTLVLEPPQPYQFQSHSPAELPLPEATPKAQKACKAAQPADQSNPASSVIDTLSGTLIIGEATG